MWRLYQAHAVLLNDCILGGCCAQAGASRSSSRGLRGQRQQWDERAGRCAAQWDVEQPSLPPCLPCSCSSSNFCSPPALLHPPSGGGD